MRLGSQAASGAGGGSLELTGYSRQGQNFGANRALQTRPPTTKTGAAASPAWKRFCPGSGEEVCRPPEPGDPAVDGGGQWAPAGDPRCVLIWTGRLLS